MEQFKKKLLSRQILLTSGLLCSCSAIMFSRYFVKEPSSSEHLQGFIEGFQVGIALGLLGFLIFFLVRNVMAMSNPERLKKLYISETDERKRFIMQKSGSVGMNIVMYGLAVRTAVSGNINDIVFFTLLGACLFVALIRGFLKFYYRTKF
ncbi:hypothetical protein [Gorillibacterium massiliense]|uniref:hypothetical protein n=1 Tax=Gorillibacterium massiliense TaxID=1280390 RepID=UPI000593CDEC|nr:hypothetical protein [Gorillibacterium massiliense]